MEQEEKAKAYDKVRKKIAIRFGSNVADEFFSEFEESEDEKVRKELINFLCELGKLGKNTNFDRWNKADCANWIAWLEKQGQVKESAISQHENRTCEENDDSLTSEDERIREALVEMVHDTTDDGLWVCYNVHKEEALAWLEKQGKKRKITHEEICKSYGIPDIGEFSDGYHTFNGLYKQRMILFAVLVKTYKDRAWKSWKHEDGLDCFGGGWFIVGIDTPAGTYTYHYEAKDWDRFDCQILEKAKHWDGHDESDVERLFSLVSNANKDEVIKCLINGMKFYYEDNEEATWGTQKFSMKVKDILDWLEKQKPIDWSDEDEKMLDSICISINEESIAQGLRSRGVSYSIEDLTTILSKQINWLKSLKGRLKPQNRWKPSELQLGCLFDAIEYYNSQGYPASKLKELYEQLKKLKEGKV